MSRLIFLRLAQLPLLLLVIYTVTFVLAWAVPGNPLEQEGRKPPKEVEEAMRAQYNLDDPVAFYVQYLIGKPRDGGGRTGGVLTGDLGPSLKYKDWTVGQIVGDALPVSIQLGAAAILIALIVGVTAGVIGAVKRGGPLDLATLSVALIGISMPTFVTGSLLLMIFTLQLRWLSIGWGSVSQLIMPAITLSLPFAAYIARLTRLGMIDVMSSDFVRTARAKGVGEGSVIFKHALKVAFLPVLSFLGPAAAAAMTGSFVVEKVFNIPGMGKYFVDAVLNKDLFLIMGVVLVYSTLLIVFNLLVDLAYSLVDPRIELD
ncbi:MAG: ABC transporter permease subunit [Phycisphaera sp.]|nr:ABC transporter permease subunit [Phycisphaera sp.]